MRTRTCATLGLVILWVVGFFSFPAWGAEAPAASPPARAAAIKVTPATREFWKVAESLNRQGLKMVRLAPGNILHLNFLVPPEMRRREVSAEALVEKTARDYRLRVRWCREGDCAVFYRGEGDETVARVLKALASEDPAARAEAARSAGDFQDVRVVSPLVAAARGSDAKVAGAALRSLRRFTWPAVLAVAGDEAWPLVEKELREPPTDRSVATGHPGWAARLFGGERARGVLEEVVRRKEQGKDWSDAVRAMGSLGGDRAVEVLSEQAKRYNPSYAISALGAIGGEKVLAPLGEALASRDYQTRMNAAAALGAVGGEKAVRLLEKALGDQEPQVQQAAVQALGDARWEQSEELLEKALSGPDEASRAYAIAGLAKLRGRKALPLIEKALAEGKDFFRISAVQALSTLEPDAAFPVLERLAGHDNPGVRSAVASAAGALGGKRGLAILERLFADKVEYIPPVVAAVLADMGSPEAIAILEKMLADPSADTRAGAVSALQSLGGEPGAALLAKALEDKDAKVRCAAASAMSQFGIPQPAALLSRLAEDPDSKVRDAAARMAIALGPEEKLALAEKRLQDPDPKERLRGLGLLAGLGRSRTLPLVKRAMTDKDDGVRGTAVAFARHWLDEDPGADVDEVVELGFADPYPRNGYEIAWNLINWHNAEALPIVRRMIARPEPSARIAGLMTMGVAAGQGKLDRERVLEFIRQAQKDPDVGVRREAAGQMKELKEGEISAELLAVPLADTDPRIREIAADLLERLGGGGAVGGGGGDAAIHEQALASKDPNVRAGAAGVIPLDDAAAWERLLADPSRQVRQAAVERLRPKDEDPPNETPWRGPVWVEEGTEQRPIEAPEWGEKVLAKVMASPDAGVRRNGLRAAALWRGAAFVAFARKALGDPEKSVRAEAARTFARLDQAGALSTLENLLAAPDVASRRAAVRALKQIRNEKAFPLFAKALEDAEKSVRTAAVEALEETTLPGAEAVLDQALRSPRAKVRAAVAPILCDKAKGEKSREILEQALADKTPEVRAAILRASSAVKHTDLMEKGLGDESGEVRLAAVEALGRVCRIKFGEEIKAEEEGRKIPRLRKDVPVALRLLEKAALDPKAEVRLLAFQAMQWTFHEADMLSGIPMEESRKLGPEEQKKREQEEREKWMDLRKRARKQMEKALADPSEKIRLAAVRSLEGAFSSTFSIGDEKEDRAFVEQARERAMGDEDESVRVTAAKAVAERKGPRALLDHPDPVVRAAAVREIDTSTPEESLPLLKKALADREGMVRGNAAYILGGLAGRMEKGAKRDEAFDAIRKVMAEPDADARAVGVLGLGALEDERGLAIIEEVLGAADMRLRTNAVMALGMFAIVLQAFIFMLLSAVYVAGAIEVEEH
ncbi:MAG: HEAT repeat domain-containing protein [Planctomycetota bacterium]